MRRVCGAASGNARWLSFDPFALFDDGLSPSEVGIDRCHVVQALLVALVVVVLDERVDLGFEISK